MPVFLFSASGVFVRADIGFNEAGLGAAVAAFMGATAISSVGGGRLAERLGAGNALKLGIAGSALSMGGLALVTHRYSTVVLALALGGASNGVTQPAANMALARRVVSRPALMFGVKQSAVPIITILAGASVPLVALTIGWRWSLIMASGLSLLLILYIPRGLADGVGRRSKGRPKTDVSTLPLVSLALATGIGTAAAVSFGSFFVEATIAGGLDAGSAGWLLAIGSVAGVGGRLLAGVITDRYDVTLGVVVVMMLLGAGGFFSLATGRDSLLLMATLISYGAGWGWTGAMMYATVRLNPNAPAASTGVVQSGAAVGAALGPLMFGYIAANVSFQSAWVVTGSLSLLGACLTVGAQKWLKHDRGQFENS
jgi:predicted MFS family arabinose efflux permease